MLVSCNLPDSSLAFSNHAYVHPVDYDQLKSEFRGKGPVQASVKGLVLVVEPLKTVEQGNVALNKLQRTSARIGLGEQLPIMAWSNPTMPVASLALNIATVKRDATAKVADTDIETLFRARFGECVLSAGQLFPLEKEGTTLQLKVLKMEPPVVDGKPSSPILHGTLDASTEFDIEAAEGANVVVTSKKVRTRNLFQSNFNFQALGIGGLDSEFQNIFRRAFASRVFPPHVAAELGIQHVKGMLLYGPPGTGKTLIARQIGKALKAREPKIVNGPEVLNKFVGQSEENIRALFKDAEDEQRSKGDNSSLHIIIFDEIDAICKSRGSNPSGAGVNDSIVNQLLSKIDGVDSLNNILLIGMTNRMDMIDDALLRPGRLEVHVEIGLPDEAGRLQILRIHTENMKDSDRLAGDVDLGWLAGITRNFSGAEIAGLCRSAASFAFSRNVDVNNLGNQPDIEDLKVTQTDFQAALGEVRPAYGAEEGVFENQYPHGIIEFSSEVNRVLKTLETLTEQVRESPSTSCLSCCLTGAKGSGKSALAAYVAVKAMFPFMKLISPDDMVGFGELAKVDKLNRTFQDAYKSQLSLVMIDNVERLMDYSPMGPRFSNNVLQALMILMNKAPPTAGRRIFIIATTSQPEFMEDCGFLNNCQVVLTSPLARTQRSITKIMKESEMTRNFPKDVISEFLQKIPEPVGVKLVLQAAEMAAQYARSQDLTADLLLDCLRDCGYGK
ncbi:MAG: uncharacterized protein KVP18_001297 [Porospora cf. gigantea A]|uniref:uncharacterized protein n=2 Tax=Porospora cf. gigantea A TaxID=2853593 RepID=UPI003559A542|nr:MAG: hypothetical protein KVP18_001297 [Porospora cf. gigantea A]